MGISPQSQLIVIDFHSHTQERHIQSRSRIDNQLLRKTRSNVTRADNGPYNGPRPVELFENKIEEDQLPTRFARNRSCVTLSHQGMAQPHQKTPIAVTVAGHRTNA